MSTCISAQGEYGEHEPDDAFTCQRCFAFDEQAALDTIARLRRGGEELGKSLVFWMNLAVEVSGSQDCVDDDGDGDWGAVAERLAAMKHEAAR